MNAMTEFKFHTHAVRVFPNEENTSFVAVAADIASILGHATAKDFTRTIPDKHKGRQFVPTPSGRQEMLVVDEPGLYYGLLRSNKPEAEPFVEWVTTEVLPSIRRTGGYMHASVADSLKAQLAMASEVGALRDDFRAMQQEFVGVLKSHVKTSERCVRLQRQVTRLQYRESLRVRNEMIARMEMAAVPRADIARAAGQSQKTLRKTIFDLRKAGLITDTDNRQGELL